MQLIDSSERADTLLSKRTEWDSNQLPSNYEPEVQTTTIPLHTEGTMQGRDNSNVVNHK